MTVVTVYDIINFAERVERMCDFLLDGVEKDGSDDVTAVQKLKTDAVDLQRITKNSNVSIEGLDNYMRGIPISNKE